MADKPAYFETYTPPGVAHTLVGSPRFGHTSDISSLASSSAESADYVKGLVAAAVLTAVCFFVAMLCILIFMCCGKKRVGFLSGAPFVVRGFGDDDHSTPDSTSLNSFSSRPSTPQKGQSLRTSSNNTKQGCCGVDTPTCVRGTFIFSGSIFILFSVLLVTQGLTNLQETVVSVYQTSLDVDSLATDANDIINTGFIGIRGVASSVRDGLNTELTGNNFCPADPTLANNDSAASIRAQAVQALDLLSALDDFLGSQVDDISHAIAQVGKGAQQVGDTAGNVDLTNRRALIVLIPFTLVPCLLVAAVILSMFDVHFPLYNRLINWVLMPLFVLMVIFSAVVASAMIAGASANSDFCLPGGRPGDNYAGVSPDTSVFRILDKKNYNQISQVRQVADYYVKQCQNATDPFIFLKDYLPNLTDSQTTLTTLTASLGSGGTLAELALYCNRDFNSVDTLLSQMGSILDSLVVAITQTIDILSCERIVPLYHKAVYEGACQYSVSAVFWVFSASIITGSFGLLMILFRAAYKPTMYDDDLTELNGRVVYEADDSPKDSIYDDDSYGTPDGRHSDAKMY